MKIKNLLPEHPRIYDLIKQRTEQQGNIFKDTHSIIENKNGGGFDWSLTSEGVFFWENICKGNYSIFYTKYPAEEWIPKAGDWIVATEDYPYFKKGMVAQINDSAAYPLSDPKQGCFDIGKFIGNACMPYKSGCRKAFPHEIPVQEDLLAEAIRRYPVGTRYKSQSTEDVYTVQPGDKIKYYGGSKDKIDINCKPFIYFNDTWSEIVEEAVSEPSESLLNQALRLYPIGTTYYIIGTPYKATVIGTLKLRGTIITDGNGGSVYNGGEWAKIILPGGVNKVPSHNFKVGEKVLHHAETVTILGFDKEQTWCVIQLAKGGHEGDITKYWHDEFSNPIPYVNGYHRYYVLLNDIKKLPNKTKIPDLSRHFIEPSINPVQLVMDIDKPSKPDYVAKVKHQIQMIPVKKIKVRNN